MADRKKGAKSRSRRKAPVADEERDVAATEAEDGSGDDDEDGEPDDEEIVAEVVGMGADDDADEGDDDIDRVIGAKPSARQSGGGSKRSLVRHDPLTAYVQETRRYPLLSREEEHELAVKLVEDGDMDAARKLIEANLRLVVKIAYEYRRAHRNLLDLVQEGNVGLMQAVKKYDPYRGVKLSTYAAWWIRAYILKFILNNWRMVKIGTTQAQRKLFFNLRKEKEKLEQLGFSPDTKLLADRLDVREKDVIEMEKRLSAPDASLDAPLGGGDDDGGGARTRMDMLESRQAVRPDLRVEERQFHEVLKEKLEQFAESIEGREETIFRERWLTDEPLTLQEIGDRYGVSRERARQIEKRLMGRLRDFLEKELGSAVDIDALVRE